MCGANYYWRQSCKAITVTFSVVSCSLLPLGGTTFENKYLQHTSGSLQYLLKDIFRSLFINLVNQPFPKDSFSKMCVQRFWHGERAIVRLSTEREHSNLIWNLRVSLKLLPAGLCQCVSVSVCAYSDIFCSKQLDSQRLCMWLSQVSVGSWDSWGQKTFFQHELPVGWSSSVHQPPTFLSTSNGQILVTYCSFNMMQYIAKENSPPQFFRAVSFWEFSSDVFLRLYLSVVVG